MTKYQITSPYPSAHSPRSPLRRKPNFPSPPAGWPAAEASPVYTNYHALYLYLGICSVCHVESILLGGEHPCRNSQRGSGRDTCTNKAYCQASTPTTLVYPAEHKPKTLSPAHATSATRGRRPALSPAGAPSARTALASTVSRNAQRWI